MKVMTRYYDVQVGGMFKFMGALFVVMPYDWEEDVYLNLCLFSKSPSYKVGCKYSFFNDTPVIKVNKKTLENLYSSLDK